MIRVVGIVGVSDTGGTLDIIGLARHAGSDGASSGLAAEALGRPALLLSGTRPRPGRDAIEIDLTRLEVQYDLGPGRKVLVEFEFDAETQAALERTAFTGGDASDVVVMSTTSDSVVTEVHSVVGSGTVLNTFVVSDLCPHNRVIGTCSIHPCHRW